MNPQPDEMPSHDDSHVSSSGLVSPEAPGPWPRSGDSLLSLESDTWNNACLNFARNPWDLYAVGYLEAADHLSDRAIETGQGLDTSVYPIVFLYRQYLELRLKELILQGKELLSLPADLKKTHHLDQLWRSVREILEKVWPNEPNMEEAKAAVEGCIDELCKIDKNSEEFRYPFRKDNALSLPELKYINIRNFKDVMQGIATLLDRCSFGISVYLDGVRRGGTFFTG